MTYLVHVRDDAIIAHFPTGTGRVRLANGDTVSPPEAGFAYGPDRVVPLVEETVTTATTARTRTTIAETVEAGRVLRFITVEDLPVTASDVRAEGARRLRALAAGYTEEERETWATQVQEARTLAADPAAPAPMLAALAAADGVTPAGMAAVVLAKAAAFSGASGAILAAQRSLIAMSPIPVDFTEDRHWPPQGAPAA